MEVEKSGIDRRLHNLFIQSSQSLYNRLVSILQALCCLHLQKKKYMKGDAQEELSVPTTDLRALLTTTMYVFTPISLTCDLFKWLDLL